MEKKALKWWNNLPNNYLGHSKGGLATKYGFGNKQSISDLTNEDIIHIWKHENVIDSKHYRKKPKKIKKRFTKKEYKKLIKSVAEKTAQDIITMIGESTTIIYKDKPMEVVKNPINVPNSPLKPNDKKQEMIESLEYLKKKPVKTKQDKISIDMLEAVLKNIS